MKQKFLSISPIFVMTAPVGHLFRRMRTKLTRATPRKWPLAISILMGGVTMNACATDTMKWKEEVVLHDGKTLVVARTKTLGGYPTVDSRDRQTLNMTMTFTVPDTNREATWKSDFGRGNEDNLNLLMLDFVNGVPYIATYPAGCLAYNKWGRPNPFYVFFKYDNAWKKISLQEFPPELKETNVVVGGPTVKERGSGYLTVARVKELNRDADKEYHTIIRTPITYGPGNIAASCPKMIYDGKGGWLGIDWFTSQPSYETCLKVCTQKKISAEYCPCRTLFKDKEK